MLPGRRIFIGFLLIMLLAGRHASVAQCNLLCNTDFENQLVGTSVAIVDASNVPCWNTTAPDNNIEVWHTGFNGVPSYSGVQFIELNAYYVSTLYQNFSTTPGTALSISFAHRGRAGTDTMSVSIGPVGGPYVLLGTYGDGVNAWGYYTVNYTIPAGSPTNYSIRFNSIYAAGGNQAIGNFLDAISASLSNTFVPVMTSTNIPCGASGNSGSADITNCTSCSYTWSPSGGNGASAMGLATGAYTVQIQDAGGCIHSSTVNITQSTSLTYSLATQDISCNGLSNGSAAISNCSSCSYTWSTGSNAASVSGLGAGNYSVIAQANGSCAKTSTFSITEPSAIAATSAVSSGTCGANGSATVTASGGTGALSYSWSPSGGNGPSAGGLAGGTYTTLVSDANGCSKTVLSNITISSTYTMSLSSTGIACHGGNTGSAAVSITGGVSPFSYTWTVNGVNAGTTPAISSLHAGVYYLTADDASGCISTQTITVAEPAAIIIAVPAIQVCQGQQATITPTVSGGTAPYTYQWLPSNASTPAISVSPTVTSTYTLIITDSQNCPSASATFTANVWPPLSVTVSGPTLVCSGSSTSLTAMAAGGNGNYQYTWQPGGFTGSQLQQPVTANTQFTVTVTDGCTSGQAQSSVPVNVLPLLSPAPTAINSEGCPPLCITAYDSTLINSGSVAAWHWSFSNGSSSNAMSPTLCFQQPGNYTGTLTVVSSNGCASSSAGSGITIHVYPQPHAEISANFFETTLTAPDFTLTNSSTGYDMAFWDLGADTYTTSSIFYSATENGTYPVTLTVINPYGCRDSITRLLIVKPDFTFYAPNAFTPNSDAYNESFMPLGIGWKDNTYQLLIFDRWGEQIFSTSDIYKGWNGRLKSSELVKEDVYVWKVELDDVFNKHHSYIGSVLVLH